MSDCRLTKQVQHMIDLNGELHSEVAIRMPDGNVWKVHHDGSTELLWKVSNPDAPKIGFHFTDI